MKNEHLTPDVYLHMIVEITSTLKSYAEDNIEIEEVSKINSLLICLCQYALELKAVLKAGI